MESDLLLFSGIVFWRLSLWRWHWHHINTTYKIRWYFEYAIDITIGILNSHYRNHTQTIAHISHRPSLFGMMILKRYTVCGSTERSSLASFLKLISTLCVINVATFYSGLMMSFGVKVSEINVQRSLQQLDFMTFEADPPIGDRVWARDWRVKFLLRIKHKSTASLET